MRIIKTSEMIAFGVKCECIINTMTISWGPDDSDRSTDQNKMSQHRFKYVSIYTQDECVISSQQGKRTGIRTTSSSFGREKKIRWLRYYKQRN